MLDADFSKTFPKGPTVGARLLEPSDPSTVTAILGPSGGGKTTILRCLAGLERPDTGMISFAGDLWFDAGRRWHVPPERRCVGMLFQDYALFPHMTVADNIRFAFGRATGAAADRVGELLRDFQLAGLDRRYPRQLSGGQQQRVALARAIAARPRLLLLDEPLAALDVPTRDEIRQPLKRLLAQLEVPVVLVTHDRLDALALASRVIVVDQGRIVQAGPIADVFAAPLNANVARMVGVETIVSGVVTACDAGVCAVAVGRTTVRGVGGAGPRTTVDICIRAEDVALFGSEPTAASAQNLWRGRIVTITDAGGIWRVTIDCGFVLTALVTRSAGAALGLAEGGEVWAAVKATAVTTLAR